jgi:S-adenosylmethionine:tRNA ribosyltransferase-isomerase
MKLSLFDYDLPKHLIAQEPSRRRDQSRLMVLDRSGGEIRHGRFAELLDYLKPGDALVVNNTRVFKARLLGKRATGGQVEIFLVRMALLSSRGPDSVGAVATSGLPRSDVPPDSGPSPLAMTGHGTSSKSAEVWEALVQPSRRLKEGERVIFGPTDSIELVGYLGDGRWRVAFDSTAVRQRIIHRYGHVPLPQYINREDSPSDLRRYQTVFANAAQTGAVAAPTAGFHLTKSLLKLIHEKQVAVCEVTLHVGPGTFKPITADEIEQHKVDPEYAILSLGVADTLNRTRQSGGRIFAVGTTSVRTLESAPCDGGRILPFEGMVELYIRGGHQFRFVDHLVTNFHLPKSSLLVLVAAFAGRERVLAAYAEAVAQEYRFYSYGDAMLIL